MSKFSKNANPDDLLIRLNNVKYQLSALATTLEMVFEINSMSTDYDTYEIGGIGLLVKSIADQLDTTIKWAVDN